MPGSSDGVALIVADDAAVRDSLALLLETYGLRPSAHPSAAACLAGLDAAVGRLLLVHHAASRPGLEAVRAFRRLGHRLPAIVVAPRGGAAERGDAARIGATMVDPVEGGALHAAIAAALGTAG